MFSFLSLLFAVHAGTLSGASPPAISVREEAFAAAAHSELAPSVLLDSEHFFGQATHAPEWLASKGSALPVFQSYGPEEWISSLAHELHAEDARITRAALFIASMPVQLNVTPMRVYVTLRFRTF
ncbi:MAG TPA: hypothetical protein VLV17_04430 [Anaeromyxobacteraceae bacterium]|nr:hypothetical protein [Anaeromyxobacteraceae bacterium]